MTQYGLSECCEQASAIEEARARAARRLGGILGPRQNISDGERLLSALGGSALVLAGLGRGKLSGLLMTLGGGALLYRGLTGYCRCYAALGIGQSERSPGAAVAAEEGVKVSRAITINAPAEELYAFWREAENLPRVMRHVERVEPIDGNRSQWFARGPLGHQVTWQAEVITDREGDMIAWRSLPGGDVETAGSIHFRPQGEGRGTEVLISLKYNPPGGRVSDRIMKLLGRDLDQEIQEDLCCFKSLMESREVPSGEGRPGAD